MDRELLSEALGGVADRHIEAALREGEFDMKKHMRLRRITVLAAAAALLLAMGVTAYAAGWLGSIFGQAAQKINTNDQAEDRLEAAAAAVSEAPQEPVTQDLPAFDSSRLTLKESYYDGQGLLLGVDLDAARPDPVVGYEPDEALLARITQPNQTYQFYYSTQEDIEQLREFIKENTSDPAELDEQLARELTGEEYDEFWKLLEKDRAACVVLQDVYIGDHMLAEGIDIVADKTDVAAGTFIEAQTPAGDGGRLSADMPEDLQGLDELHVQLKVKGGPVYYYMTLDGRAYVLSEQAEEQLVPFTIPNSAK